MKTKSVASLLGKDIMNPRVEALNADEAMVNAIHWLLRRGYAGAPVVDTAGRLVGVLSEHDCVRALLRLATEELPEQKVAANMTRELQTVTPETPVLEIAEKFVTKGCRRLPVVDSEGQLRGLISRRDLMKALDEVVYEKEKVSTYDILHRLWR